MGITEQVQYSYLFDMSLPGQHSFNLLETQLHVLQGTITLVHCRKHIQYCVTIPMSLNGNAQGQDHHNGSA